MPTTHGKQGSQNAKGSKQLGHTVLHQMTNWFVHENIGRGHPSDSSIFQSPRTFGRSCSLNQICTCVGEDNCDRVLACRLRHLFCSSCMRFHWQLPPCPGLITVAAHRCAVANQPKPTLPFGIGRRPWRSSSRPTCVKPNCFFAH